MELIPWDIQEAFRKKATSYVVEKSLLPLKVADIKDKTYEKIKWNDYWWFDNEEEALARLKLKLENALEEVNKRIDCITKEKNNGH